MKKIENFEELLRAVEELYEEKVDLNQFDDLDGFEQMSSIQNFDNLKKFYLGEKIRIYFNTWYILSFGERGLVDISSDDLEEKEEFMNFSEIVRSKDPQKIYNIIKAIKDCEEER